MLSLICCNYNDSRFLIDWVKRTYLAGYDEIILIDDCSTDKSVEIAKSLGVRVIHSKEKGVFNATLCGIEEAKGDFVISGAMDDYPLECHGWMIKDAIRQYPLVDIFTYASYVEREGEKYIRNLFPFDAYVSPEYLSKLYRNGYGNQICMVAPAVRRDVLLKCYKTGIKANMDGLHNLYAMFNKGFVHLSTPLYVYRSYPNSFGSTGKAKDILEANRITIQFMKENLSATNYQHFLDSGICSNKMFFLTRAGLSIVPRLPKPLRKRFYKWFYSYDWRVEKL